MLQGGQGEEEGRSQCRGLGTRVEVQVGDGRARSVTWERPPGSGSSPRPTPSQNLLWAAHEVELQREKAAEKLERQLALPASEQAATQVSIDPPAVCPPRPPAPCSAPDPPPLPRSLPSGRCARGC